MSVFYDLNKTPRNILNQAIVRAIVSENNGALFDPSDLSTLYQDAAGTTPVTAVEQPVGLMLDKSRWLMLGPELVSNGTFDSDLSSWSQNNTAPATITSISGVATWNTSSGGSGRLFQDFATVAGRSYKITYNVLTSSGGSATTLVYDVNSATDVVVYSSSAAQTYSRVFIAKGPITRFQLSSGNYPYSIDNFSVKELYGYHATQPITASRPTLSARYNLLTKTEDFSDAVWVKLRGVISSSGVLFKLTEDTTLNTHYVYQSITKPANSPISISQVAKAGERKWLRFALDSMSPPNGANQIRAWFNLETGTIGTVSTVGTYSSATAEISKIDADTYVCTVSGITSSETTCSYFVSPATDNNVSSYQGDGMSSIYFGRASATIGVNSGPYQRVNTATDYDTDERYFPKYLRGDAVDDFMNLPFMSLYGGGSASIICARDAVSQATDTYIISERSTTDADPKYFPSRQLANAGNMDTYITDDAGAIVLDTVGSPFSGVANAVIRSIVDSGNNLKLFKNGVLAANDNYTRSGALTLNNTTIGASVSTTTSNYASMKLYGLIVTKSALTDAQRVACERYLGRKSGVQL